MRHNLQQVKALASVKRGVTTVGALGLHHHSNSDTAQWNPAQGEAQTKALQGWMAKKGRSAWDSAYSGRGRNYPGVL